MEDTSLDSAPPWIQQMMENHYRLQVAKEPSLKGYLEQYDLAVQTQGETPSLDTLQHFVQTELARRERHKHQKGLLNATAMGAGAKQKPKAKAERR